jgi:hypothetical protein
MVFGFPSHDPRWTYRTIHRWRTFSTSPYLRWHTFPTKPPEEGPCDARQARRNHATSAAAFRLSRKRQDAATASGPHRATRCAMSFSRTGTGANLRPAARGGDKFFRGFAEVLVRSQESVAAKLSLSPPVAALSLACHEASICRERWTGNRQSKDSPRWRRIRG